MKLWRTSLVLAIAGTCSLAVASPAAAAKSDKDELGKLETGTATVSTPTTGTFTAIAECPKGTKVVGGGFILQAPPAGGDDFFNPLESRREGKKAWRVSAYRVDGSNNGPVFTMSAEAYCRSGLGKLSEKIETETVVGGVSNGTPNATCGVGKSALSGGFALSGPPTANLFHNYLFDNLMTGSVGWVSRSMSLTPAPNAVTYTSYVYCQKKGEKAPKAVTGVGTIPGTALAIGTADTASCSGKRDAFIGGFRVRQFFAGTLALITESRHVGKGWHVAASNLGGGAASNFAALGYCS